MRSNVNKHELVNGESSSNARDAPNVCLSSVLLFTIFIIVYGNPIAPSLYSISPWTYLKAFLAETSPKFPNRRFKGKSQFPNLN